MTESSMVASAIPEDLLVMGFLKDFCYIVRVKNFIIIC